MPNTFSSFMVTAVVSSTIVCDAAIAQDYPQRPIRIVTAAAGAGSDFNARQIAQAIAGPLGQPVVIDNRTALLAAEVVAKAPPDGYTLMVGSDSFWTISLLRKTSYDPVQDFSPVSLVSREISAVVVHPSLPVKSVKELIALAQSRPGQLTFSSTPPGSGPNFAGQLFKSMAGIDIVIVSYNGGLPAITALVAGETQLSIPSASSAIPHVRSGKLRALAVTSLQPSALMPGLPTVAASGLPSYEIVSVTGVFAAARTTSAILSRLNREIVRALEQPELKERFLLSGMEAFSSTPDQLGGAMKASIAMLSKMIKEANIKVD